MSITNAAPSQAAAPAAPLSTKERLDQAQKQLADMRRRFERGSRLTIVLGSVFILALGIYFYLGAKVWAELTQPEKLVNWASVQLDDHMPGLRTSLEKEIIKAAPDMAASLSRQLIKAIPDARKKLAVFAADRFDESLKEADLLTEANMRRVLKTHRAMLTKQFAALEKDEKVADKSMQELVDALENELDVDFQKDAKKALKTLKAANVNSKDILAGSKLTEDQKLERRVWQLARRLQLQYQGVEPPLVKGGKLLPQGKDHGKKGKKMKDVSPKTS
jgi:hypothetical protein